MICHITICIYIYIYVCTFWLCYVIYIYIYIHIYVWLHFALNVRYGQSTYSGPYDIYICTHIYIYIYICIYIYIYIYIYIRIHTHIQTYHQQIPMRIIDKILWCTRQSVWYLRDAFVQQKMPVPTPSGSQPCSMRIERLAALLVPRTRQARVASASSVSEKKTLLWRRGQVERQAFRISEHHLSRGN